LGVEDPERGFTNEIVLFWVEVRKRKLETGKGCRKKARRGKEKEGKGEKERRRKERESHLRLLLSLVTRHTAVPIARGAI
jgi:hypothetical protein